MEPSAERRAANARRDLDERQERIYTEAISDLPKADSLAITNDEEAAFFDRLREEAHAIEARGREPVYDIRD